MADITKNTACYMELHSIVPHDLPHLKVKSLKRTPLCLVVRREESCIKGKIEIDFCETCGEVLTRTIIR